MILDIRIPELDAKLDAILLTLRALTQREVLMSQQLDDLTAQVRANSTVLQSAITLINGIADRIKAAGTDPVALQALTDELAAKDADLSAAVVANTPPTEA